MKKLIVRIAIVISVILSLSLLGASTADKKSGKDVMEKWSNLPSFEKMQGEQVMNIYGADGSLLFTKEARNATYIENFGKKGSEVRKTIVYFFKPSEEKGNSTLSISYEDPSKEDLLMVYLVGLKKPKRIAGSMDKRSSYMGSDFTNNDIAFEFELDNYSYKMLEDEKIDFKGHALKCYKIEATPVDKSLKDETGYGKVVYFLEKKSLLNLKTEFYDENLEKYKELTITSFKTISNKDGKKVRFPLSITMKNVQKGTRTEIVFKKLLIENEANFNTNIFTEQYLTRRWW